MIGHRHISVNGAAAGIGGLGQNGAIARRAFLIEEDGRAVVAALDRMQRLVGQKIPATPRRPLAPSSEPREATPARKSSPTLFLPCHGKPITGPLGGLWRYRVGDCRVICDIEDCVLRVLVLRIGDRKDVYRKARR